MVFIDQLADANCPCPELLDEWKSNPLETKNRTEYYIGLGILELFCGNKNGCIYFEKAKKISPNLQLIDELLNQVQ